MGVVMSIKQKLRKLLKKEELIWAENYDDKRLFMDVVIDTIITSPDIAVVPRDEYVMIIPYVKLEKMQRVVEVTKKHHAAMHGTITDKYGCPICEALADLEVK